MGKRVKVKGVRRQDIDVDQLAFVFWTMAKRQVEEKRKREQEERDKRSGEGGGAMNTDLVPAAVAIGGGAATIGAIVAYERRRDAAMRASRIRLSVRYPVGVADFQVESMVRALSGLDDHAELVLELDGQAHRVGHSMLIPEKQRSAVEAMFASIVPGARVEEAAAENLGMATLAVRLYLPTPLVLHESRLEGGARQLLGAFDALSDDERITLRWAVRPTRPRRRSSEPNVRDREQVRLDRAYDRKTAMAGFEVAGLLLVRAGSRTRARQLVDRVLAAIRARENHVGSVRPTLGRGRSFASLPQVTRSSGWLNIDELAPLLGIPIGDEAVDGLEMGGARERRVPRTVARSGRVLFIGRDVQGERPVALTAEAARHHSVVVGPSGVGKSVLIGRSILDDIHHGYGGVVLDPKADLIDDVLNRVEPEAADRIVVLDPADTRPVPGVDGLGVGDPDLASDVLVGALANIFKDSFGIRSQLYLRLGLRTLAEVPGGTVADLPQLFFDGGFRRRAVGRLTDAILLTQWQAFEALSANARAEHVQSPMAKVTALISRPAVRSVLASPQPGVDIAGLLAHKKWLFISLSPGRLGEQASRLLASVLMYGVWNAVEARAALPPEKRRPVFLYIDELSSLASLPIGLENLLERARGLGAGLTVAVQSLARVPESVRSSLLGNAATLITFRAGADEANRLSRELPGMSARDLQALGQYEVTARVGLGSGSSVAIVTGRSQPWPTLTNLAATIRDQSAERYGARPEPVPEAPQARNIEPDDEVLGRGGRAV